MEKESLEKQRGGVADYFAIIGVGQDLIWNHAQTKSTSEETSSHPEEDEAMLTERFYREIVECKIMTVEANNEAYSSSLSVSQRQFVLGMSSPSASEVALGIGNDDGKLESGGWTVLKETRPVDIDAALGRASFVLHPPSRKGQVWEANLDPVSGLAEELQGVLGAQLQLEHESRRSTSTPLKDFRRKVTSSFTQRLILADTYKRKKFYLSFRRRAPDEIDLPAIASIELKYVRLHKVTLDTQSDFKSATESVVTSSTVPQKGAAALLRVAEAGKNVVQSRILGSQQIEPQGSLDISDLSPVALETLLELPAGFDEWSIPEPFQMLNLPSQPHALANEAAMLHAGESQSSTNTSFMSEGNNAVEYDPTQHVPIWREKTRPRIVEKATEIDENFLYIPILAIRRQRVGEEERFHEDCGIVDLSVSFWNRMGEPSIPVENADPFEDEEINNMVLRTTEWKTAAVQMQSEASSPGWKPPAFGTNCLLFKRNLPLGFCDATFKATVLDRFPYKNYKGLPLPEEELPMFCYPTGCHLHRARYKDTPIPQYYGFVVKNERGDSIYVSCVSFFEPLTKEKKRQLRQLSERRKRTSLPHARLVDKVENMTSGARDGRVRLDEFPDMLIGFDDMTTFENKTICLVGRYPYWTAFRKFLSHLHSISCSSSELPLERYISHLLLTVPVPKPGGPSILIPLPTLSIPVIISSPPSKDLPLVDLSYERLISCLDIPTVVAVVLGFLALERKVCESLPYVSWKVVKKFSEEGACGE